LEEGIALHAITFRSKRLASNEQKTKAVSIFTLRYAA
jgi:hypothetical protein